MPCHRANSGTRFRSDAARQRLKEIRIVHDPDIACGTKGENCRLEKSASDVQITATVPAETASIMASSSDLSMIDRNKLSRNILSDSTESSRYQRTL